MIEEGVWFDVCGGVEDVEDGEYLTAIQVGDQVEIEIAPWRNGRYQGMRYMLVFLGKAKVLKFMIIPPIELILK